MTTGDTWRRCRRAGIWRRPLSFVRLTIAPIIAVLALAAAPADAENPLSIAVSPPSTIGDQSVQLGLSGSQPSYQPAILWALVGEERCPGFFSDLRTFGIHVYASGEAQSLPYTAAVPAPPERGMYRFCAWSNGGVREAQLTVTESREEATLAEAAAEERAAEAAARERAHKTPVTHLSVKPVAHRGHSTRYPGYTGLSVTTAPYAYVVVSLTRYGHTTERWEWGAESTEIARVIQWTCTNPGGVYRYVVTASSGVGRTLVRRGQFAPVSASRCHSLKRHEAEARERAERKAAEEASQEEREHREERERFEANCRAEGGTPITLYTARESYLGCRAPYGGLLHPPY
jgi:hypothetical protein